MSTPDEVPPPQPKDSSPGRLVSLDAFRGLTIAGMILVNNPGDWGHVYAPLKHAKWHGWTPTDLVFPSFLFIVGVAIPLALGKRLSRGDALTDIIRKVAVRSLLIFALGLALNAFPFDRPVATLRVPGVLQRIALCYFAASLIFLTTSVRAQVGIMIGLLVGYWGLMMLVPVPGVGSGDLTRPNNLAAWIDRGLMPGHIYRKEYDPEGLLSTLPAIATTLIGVLTGRWLSTARPIAERVAGVFAAGTVCYLVGWSWGMIFPLNKALWTSSFTLYSAGLSLLIFGVCAWLIEVENIRGWSWPFVIFGSNAIAAYVLSGIGLRVASMVNVGGPSAGATNLRSFVYANGFTSWAEPTLASLLFGISYVLLWLLVLSVLYRLRWFIRL